jgi:phosphate-selective porin
MKASRKALLLGLCMAASAITAPTIASAGVAIDIDVAPPPVRVETDTSGRRATGSGAAASTYGCRAA